MQQYANLRAGEPAPWFHARSDTRAEYAFDTTGGRYLVLCFFATAGDAKGKAAIQAAFAEPQLFDDRHASFFGVSIDPRDEAHGRAKGRLPG